MAKKKSIAVLPDEAVEVKEAKKAEALARQPDFVDVQLAQSGLTAEDVVIKAIRDDENSTKMEFSAFQRGTIDQYGREVDGNDMIIRYYDLDGRLETYRTEKGRDLPFFRIRYAIPEQHPDKSGKPMKYRSPAGSGNHIYIPQKVRSIYQHKRPLERLYITEGEKKAEKMCKHGLLTLGIPGITALADKNKRLPQSVEQLVRVCGVKEVFFMLDGDLFNISKNPSPDTNILQRPRSFFFAVKNFKEYFRTFYNIGINLQIYFGYVNPALKEKGMDDLLVSINGNEDSLKSEINTLLNEKDMRGALVSLHRISTMTDQQLEAIWGYNDPEAFAIRHKEVLQDMPFFTMWKHKWRFNENGVFESAQPLENDEKYWDVQVIENKYGQEQRRYQFHYGRCFNFLKNRGFGRIKQVNGSYAFARVDGRIVAMQDTWEIRDFVIDFTKAIKEADVLELLYRGGVQYLGPERLSNLEFIAPPIEVPGRSRQNIYFDKKIWQISDREIKEVGITELESYIWEEDIKRFDARLLDEPLIAFTPIDDELLAQMPLSSRSTFTPYKGKFLCDISEEGEKCHFLSFLQNASNFSWRKPFEETTMEERFENIEHLLAKLTAMGYLLHNYKDPGVCKAVVAMDGKLSEVGASNGRTGKSLLGKAIAQMVNQVYIGGKSKNLTEDNFLYNDVTDKTKNIFIDDVRANLDFEHFFPLITGDLSVNVKSGGRFILPFSKTPKLLITTNHAINGDGSSFADRQWVIAFSDYYNDTHKPVDDFGVSFFSEWDYAQWNLFYNLCACSIHLYLKFGVVESPNDKVVIRKLRQEMGEEFLMWAEEYFSDGADTINIRIPRKEMYDKFITMFPQQAKFTSQTLFKKKIRSYCEFKGYTFNKGRYDDKGNPIYYDKNGMPIIDDKTGGVEYFTVADDRFEWPTH